MKRLYPDVIVTRSYVFSASLWVFFVFLTVVFFLSQHDLFHSIKWQETGLSTAHEIATATSEGSVSRRIALFLLGGVAVVSLLRRRRNPLRTNGFLGYLTLFFLVWAVLSLAWANDTALTLRRLVILAMLSLGAIAVAERFSIRQIMLLFFFCCGVFLVVGIFAEIALGAFHPFQTGYRFCGTNDPNVGSWGLATLFLTAVALASTTDRCRAILWAMAFIALAFLLLSRTRTTFAAVVLALGSYWFLISSRSRKAAFVLALSWVVCLLFLLLGDQLISGAWQVILLGRDGSGTATLTGRIPVWERCFLYVAKSPLLGYGYNGFWTPQHVIEISDSVDYGGTGVPWAFNSYIDLILGVGFVGAGAYILMLTLAIKRSVVLYKRSNNRDYAFVYAMIVFFCIVMLLEGIASDTGIASFAVFTLLAKLAFSVPPPC